MADKTDIVKTGEQRYISANALEKFVSDVRRRLPKESLNVLIYIPFRGAHLHYVSYMESGLWYVPTMYGRSSLDDVTHWMPPPEHIGTIFDEGGEE